MGFLFVLTEKLINCSLHFQLLHDCVKLKCLFTAVCTLNYFMIVLIEKLNYGSLHFKLLYDRVNRKVHLLQSVLKATLLCVSLHLCITCWKTYLESLSVSLPLSLPLPPPSVCLCFFLCLPVCLSLPVSYSFIYLVINIKFLV